MVPPSIIVKARYLRKESTKSEEMLWRALRGNKLGMRFRRQHPFDMFVIDFYAPSIKLAIELDGSSHNLKENKEYDEMRTDYLESKYLHVLRFWNSEVENNLDKVLDKIKKEIQKLLNV